VGSATSSFSDYVPVRCFTGKSEWPPVYPCPWPLLISETTISNSAQLLHHGSRPRLLFIGWSGGLSAEEVMWRLVLAVSLLIWDSEAQITCRDKNGVKVDWYILYKVPKLNNQDLKGLEYFYMDKEKSQWFYPISDSKSVLANTLQPLLTHTVETSDFGFISYSDQPPNKQVGSAFGHSKGIVMMDRTSGVWLRHSTPNFPYDRANGTLWPDTGTKYGQTFICVTFDYDTFKQIGAHLLHIRAFPFDSYIPDDFHQELKSVVNKEDPKPSTPFLDQELTSLSGQGFKSFAKYSSKSHAEKIYLHIADSLSSDLAACTWRGLYNEEEAELSGAHCPEGEMGEGDRAEVDPPEGEKVECPEEGRVDPLGGGTVLPRAEEGRRRGDRPPRGRYGIPNRYRVDSLHY
ncbi:hypothetical protein GJAV_G00142130, partial [Gymnothorax javanicus]